MKLGKQLFQQAIDAIKELHPAPCQMRLNVNRFNTKAIEFYQRMGMKKIFEGDFDIGHGYLMQDYIMALDI
jgi:ribosomal protein S18 acetylase RimI-like enzyme